MRDVALYPTPNNYNVFLGRQFNNVETVKLIDYFFPEMEYPINPTNNVILWYVVPYEIISSNILGFPWKYDPYIGSEYDEYKINICGWYINFSNLINKSVSTDDYRNIYNNNLLSCINKVEITSGFYTTEELSQKIKDEFQKTQFFNSNIYNKSYKEYDGNIGSETFKFKDRPQLVDVRIDPETSNVQFLLRYEEFRVKSVATYYNKNYFDMEMKVVDSSIPSPEFMELIQNDLYPIVITGFPEIGGYTGANIDYIEFVPKNIMELFQTKYSTSFYKTYYDKITDNDGNVIPNVLRFYVYNLGLSYSSTIPVKSSYTEIINENKIKFGREAPFFFINGNMSLLSNYIKFINNNINNIINYDYNCNNEPSTKNCAVISSQEQLILDNLITNVDCSSRLLTNLLGFQNTKDSKSIIGPVSGTFAIITNNIYKTNRYINSIQAYNINIDRFVDYTKCAGILPPNENNNCFTNYIFWVDYYPEFNLNFRLSISRNQNGTYSFYFNNYFFMKLLSSSVDTQIQTSSTITQIKPTANFANGSNDIYEINDETTNGIQYYINTPTYSDPKCPINLNSNSFTSATKNEVLKETNINSSNNNANTGGIKPVERNSISNS